MTIETLLLLALFLVWGIIIWKVTTKRTTVETTINILPAKTKKEKPETTVTEVKAPPMQKELPKYWYIAVDKSHKNWKEFTELFEKKVYINCSHLDFSCKYYWFYKEHWYTCYNVSSNWHYGQVSIDEAIQIMQWKVEDSKYIYRNGNKFVVQLIINWKLKHCWIFSTRDEARAKRDEILSKKCLANCKK